ncbi:unnamed protein product [Effrenium voratum]|nr:unnamed protein product [Effrenium voratum]
MHHLEERIREVREQMDRDRQVEMEVEHALLHKVEELEKALMVRRRSIVERTEKEQQREEALSKYISSLQALDLGELQHEILQRKDSVIAKEEQLSLRLVTLAEDEEEECKQIQESLGKQQLLRRQLDALRGSEGADSLRRHLSALKEAEMKDFYLEVARHRQEDEAKELQLRRQLGDLHRELQRLMDESDEKLHRSKMQEEQILQEMHYLQSSVRSSERLVQGGGSPQALRRDKQQHEEEEARRSSRGSSPISPISRISRFDSGNWKEGRSSQGQRSASPVEERRYLELGARGSPSPRIEEDRFVASLAGDSRENSCEDGEIEDMEDMEDLLFI